MTIQPKFQVDSLVQIEYNVFDERRIVIFKVYAITSITGCSGTQIFYELCPILFDKSYDRNQNWTISSAKSVKCREDELVPASKKHLDLLDKLVNEQNNN